jgi:hypothetical protein
MKWSNTGDADSPVNPELTPADEEFVLTVNSDSAIMRRSATASIPVDSLFRLYVSRQPEVSVRSHGEGFVLLLGGVMENSAESAESLQSIVRSKLPDFLLAEYEHMGESLLRNEESGEKRAAFFVTLVGAAGGILGFVFGETPPIVSRDSMPVATAAIAAVLLCLGVLTVRRLIERDIVTDQIIFALRSLRRLFLTQAEAEVLPNVFFKPYEPPRSRLVKVFTIEKGGWLRTVAFVNALLTAVVAAGLAVSLAVSRPWQIAIALAGGIAVWIAQLNYAGRRIARNHDKLKKAERIG